MIPVRNPNSLRHLVSVASEHWADARNAQQRRDELDVQMQPLMEQLEQLQKERAEWSREHTDSRDMAYDYVGMVTAACQASGWTLPAGLPDLPPLDPPTPTAPLGIEAEARAAHAAAPETTAAIPLPGEGSESGVHPILGKQGGGQDA